MRKQNRSYSSAVNSYVVNLFLHCVHSLLRVANFVLPGRESITSVFDLHMGQRISDIILHPVKV